MLVLFVIQTIVLIFLGVKIMSVLSDLANATNNLATVTTTAVALLNQLGDEHISAADAKPLIDAINASSQSLSAAVTANTPTPAPTA